MRADLCGDEEGGNAYELELEARDIVVGKEAVNDVHSQEQRLLVELEPATQCGTVTAEQHISTT
jgi:hypothetical protein